MLYGISIQKKIMAWEYGSYKLLKSNKTQQESSNKRCEKDVNTYETICKPCQHGKKTRISFKTKEYYTSNPLEPIHISVG